MLRRPIEITGFGAHLVTFMKRGGLKGWMQQWLGVYPLEFQIPTFFVAVD
jgi:hypothetical protein